jgi:hypothetical protein
MGATRAIGMPWLERRRSSDWKRRQYSSCGQSNQSSAKLGQRSIASS